MNQRLKTLKACYSSLLIGVLGVVLCLTSAGSYLEEEWGLAWLFKLRGTTVAPHEVVIVNIDKNSAESLQLPENPEKWSRAYYAQLIDKINKNNAAIIAFNIFFGEAHDPDNDGRMANMMVAGKNVVLSNYLKQYIPPNSEPRYDYRYEYLTEPLVVLEKAALGVAPFPLPKTVSTVKQFWAYKNSAGEIPTFPVIVFQSYVLRQAYPEFLQLINHIAPDLVVNLPKQFAELSGHYQTQDITRQLRTVFAKKIDPGHFEDLLVSANFSQEKERMLRAWFALITSQDILYFNHYGKSGAIQTITFADAMTSLSFNPNVYDNKIVMIGYSDNIEPERNHGFYTDLADDPGEALSSTEIAATAVANLIDNSWLKTLPLPQQLALVILWGVLLGVICRFLRYRYAVMLIFCLSAIYGGIAYYQFSRAALWIPLFIPLFAQTPSVLFLATCGHYLKNKKEQFNMFKAFTFYLPDDVVKNVVRKPEREAMDGFGELMQGVCLASDAGQYTTLSESMSPDELHVLMNQYYGVIFPHVAKTGGIISDVIGDAMLALWATPKIERTHRINACNAALSIKQSVADFNSAQPHYIRTRLGLHFGEMRLGNVGAADHYEYRAIGDIINTSTRIEGLNKFLGTDILASAPVIEGLDQFHTREMGVFILKGKTFPVKIYQLIGYSSRVDGQWLTLNNDFVRALRLFQGYQWVLALAAFEAIKKRYPNDGPTLFYIQYLSTRINAIPKNLPKGQEARIEIGNIT